MNYSSHEEFLEEIEQHRNDIYIYQHTLQEVVPMHTHSQGHILVVVGGVATMNAEHSEYYIPHGYFVWIPPRTSHRITFEGRAIRLLNIYYPPQFSQESFYREVGVYPMPSILYHVIELIEGQTEYLQPDHWKYELLATTNHILPHIIHPQHLELRLPTTDHPVVCQILGAIHRNYRNPITIQQIGREIGLSTRSLSRHMNRELHITFVQYLRIYRILMAVKQMVAANESITNIAYNVGYESLTAFSNSFYKVTGCRPSQFLQWHNDAKCPK